MILSFGMCWKEKERSEFSTNFFIEIMLEWFLYLAIAFCIGLFSLSAFVKKLWLAFILKLETKNLLKILANYLLLFIIFPFSSTVMYSVDFILLEKRGFTVAQNFLQSVMSFRSKFSQRLLLVFAVILTHKLLCFVIIDFRLLSFGFKKLIS